MIVWVLLFSQGSGEMEICVFVIQAGGKPALAESVGIAPTERVQIVIVAVRGTNTIATPRSCPWKLTWQQRVETASIDRINSRL